MADPFQTMVMNLEKWDQIPKHLQDALKEAMIETEREWPPIQQKMADAADKQMIKGGVELLKFSPEDSKYLVDLLFKLEWEGYAKDFPEQAAKLRPLLVK